MLQFALKVGLTKQISKLNFCFGGIGPIAKRSSLCSLFTFLLRLTNGGPGVQEAVLHGVSNQI